MTVREGQIGSLRPRSIGDLIDTTFRQYRSDFSYLLMVSIFLFVPYWIVQSILNYHTVSGAEATIRQLAGSLLQSSKIQPLSRLAANAPPFTASRVVANLALGILTIIVYPLIYGTILHRVVRSSLSHEQKSFGESLRYAARRLFSAIVTNIFVWFLVTLCATVGWAVAVIPIVLLSIIKISIAITIPLGILLGLGGILFTLWLVTRVALTSSVVREEKRIFWPALARSWVLTRRNFWHTLGYLALITLMVEATQGGIAGVSYLLPPIVSVIVIGLATLFVLPFQMLAVANLYVDLRVRTDGLDLQEWLNGTDDHEKLRD